MHEIAQFLREHPPFTGLASEELERLAATVEIEFHPVGTVVLLQSGGPADVVRVIRKGAVELVADGRTFDLLGEGEMFGHASMLAGAPIGFTARAQEDLLCYRIPEAGMREVLGRPDGLRFVARSLARRAELVAQSHPAGGVDTAARPVSELLRGPAVVCSPSTSVREAARRMVETGSTSAVVELGEHLGIVTDNDLRTRIVAAGAGPDTAVSAVMTAPAATVAADQTGADVLLEMLDRGVRHFPVLDAGRRVIGVIDDVDLMAAERRGPFHLRARIGRARDAAAVAAAAAQLPEVVIALLDAGVATPTIQRVITSTHDALTRRLIELAQDELGSPPVPFTWLALGSFARREAFPGSDQDSALAWVDDGAGREPPEPLRAIAARVVDDLDACGIPACSNGAVASMPLFQRSIGAWEATASSMLEDPHQEKALILLAVLVDGRPVWGADVAADRLGAALRTARAHPLALRRTAIFALAHRPPTGFFGGLVVEHSGERRGRLDLKLGGLLPIVDLARWGAMSAGVALTSTPARLEAATAAGVIPADDAAVLRDAFELVSDLRMRHRVEQLRTGAPLDDFIDPAALTALTRTSLKEAFRAVARVQRAVATTMGLPAR